MSAITFFEFLSPVLAQQVDFIAKQRGVEVDEVYVSISDEIQRNRTEWFSNRIPNLNYQHPDCRLAYLYVVAAANANIFKYVLETNIGGITNCV